MIRALTTLLLLAPLACAGSDLAGGGDTKKAGKKDKAGDDDESDKADQPQEVSGAFLTCGPDAGGKADDGNEAFGCKFADKSGKRLAGEMTEPKVKIARTSGDDLEPAAKASDDAWHLTFQAPAGTADVVKAIDVTGKLDGKAVSGKTDNLKGVPSQWESLGTVGTSDPSGTTGGEGQQQQQQPTPKQYVFLSKGVWQPGESTTEQFNDFNEADAKCKQEAAMGASAKANTNNWKAIIAGGGQGPKARITINADVYDLGDQLIAKKESFWGAHELPIGLDAAGAKVQDDAFFVWTGATPDGGMAADTCAEWEYGNTQNIFPMSYGMQGDAVDKANWLSARKGPCGTDGMGDPVELWHLYCIAQ